MSEQGFVRRQRGYPGRDQLDESSMRFRAAVSRLAREAEHDRSLARELEPIVTAACAAWDELTKRADRAAARSARNQARIRRQITQAERLVRDASSRGAALAEREAARLRALLDDNLDTSDER